MAKINFKELAPQKEMALKTYSINNNHILIEQYLPISKKMALVEKILTESVDETGFFSPMRLKAYYTIEMMRAYTNISITDKMMETPDKIYDLIQINELNKVIQEIPQSERNVMWHGVLDSASAITTYQTSLVGMMKTISNDYSATKINVEEIMKTLDQPEKVGLVKDILEKIG